MSETAGLVRAAQAGDEEAFGQLVRRFQDMAYGAAYARLGSHHLAEDAAQEAFLEAFVNLPKLRDPAAFPGWFRRVVFRRCSRIARRARATVPLDGASLAPPAPSRARDALREEVAAAVEALPEQERMVTALYYVDGYSQREVGEFLDLPVTTVKTRLHSARKRLKERMRDMVKDMFRQMRPSEDERFADAVAFIGAVFTNDVAAARRILRKNPELVNYSRMPVLRTGTALHMAAEHENLDTIRVLLDAGAGPSCRAGRDESTPLHWAAHAGNTEAVRVLAEAGADLEAVDSKYRFTPLGWALCLDRTRRDVGDLLIELGAEADLLSAVALGDEGRVRQMLADDPASANGASLGAHEFGLPLLMAAAKNGPAIVRMLLDAGADPHARNADGVSALSVAATCGADETLGLLVSAADLPDIPDMLASASLDEAGALLKDHPDWLRPGGAFDWLVLFVAARNLAGATELLLDRGADVNLRGAGKRTALHVAAWSGGADAARVLTAAGASLEARESFGGMTPLITAAFGPYSRPSDPGRLEVARILLEAGADANALTEEWEWLGEWGRSAITFGSEEMANLLRTHGAKVTVHVAGVRGWTDDLARLLDEDPSAVEWSPMERSSSPLRTALFGGHVDAVRMLLDRGADPNEITRLGTTQTAELAMAYRLRAALALSPRHRECARLLIERGAAITIHDAATLGLADVVERMLAEQPELLNSVSPRHGMTPLHCAVVGGHTGLAEQLLDRGAEVDARSRSGATPLLLAVRPFEGRAAAPADVESIRLLLDRGADVDAADRDGLTPLRAAEEGGPEAVAELLRKYAGRKL